ncbi:tRNA (N(6)-L-threonylcarbamoyladenosine(37)-C(2))-methylthiotransferase MtaB [Entomobacter blattae]|uniref:Threonylcarbamoyladenosine tRNA methylthiotransferase MtaB n=1 Tax=Entomobacter blattae TaxID=2762277 RepID=A0A7H1NQ50_9PROT|nr:tRNA (N(6)-L-threonylcarbamoyladenosine(37)-C(2))-methylthiotransferase MtaB [Entomobacter blattae]QNT77910.1 Threonylcarbamoyladenosine tRNA methylthiotransferase MtaB [Entomobacter blattae]
MKKPSPRILTFGCRLNTYESEVMRQHAEGQDVIVVNTCAVTSEAERQASQAIRKAHRENPSAPIIVTGCAAQLNPTHWANLPGVTRVLGNEEKLQRQFWAPFGSSEGEKQVTAEVYVSDIMAARKTAAHLVTDFSERSRAFVQVQQGCNHRCTFCIIPYGRGQSRSVPVGGIYKQVESLMRSGYQEIVLTGVDIASWGEDLPGKPSLGQLCKRILALAPNLSRLRLSSVDPVGMDEDMWHLFKEEPRFMPYLHLSLQAGCDMILKRMRRRHLTQDVRQVVERARSIQPTIGLGADLIAGFPTETEAMFEQTLQFVEEMAFPFLHVFPYSEREGTPAARMPQLPKKLRKARAAQLRQIGEKTRQHYYETLVGKQINILLETPNSGHSEEFAHVRLQQGFPEKIGQVVTAWATGADQQAVYAATADDRIVEHRI